MLAETRNELEEFQSASRELEAEMEADLARSEKLEEQLKAKIHNSDRERDEWKVSCVPALKLCAASHRLRNRASI